MSRLVAALMLLAGAAPAARAQAPLAWKLPKGEQFTLSITTEYRDTVTLMGKQINSRAKMSFGLDVTVREPLRAGRATLDLRIKSLRAEGSPNAEALTRTGKAIAGETVAVTLGAKMKLGEIRGVEALAKKVAEQENEPQSERVFAQTLHTLLRYLLEEALVATPGKAVTKGDTWEQNSQLDAMGLGTLLTRKTFTDLGPATVAGKEVRQVGIKGVLKFAPAKAAAGGVLPFTVEKLDLKKQQYTGTLSFDAAAGRPVRIETRLFTDMAMTIGVNGMTVEAEGTREQTFRIQFGGGKKDE